MSNETKKLPEEFVGRLIGETAVDGEALVSALSSTSPVVGVRVNPSKPGDIPVWLQDARPVTWSRHGFYLDERPEFTLTPALHAGGIYVQDPSSMIHEEIVARLTSDGKPVRVLDVCAAPGGKTTAAIASLPENSFVVANEVMPPRASILAENIVKWGYPSTIVTSASADALGKLCGMFDIIILDAPCSGEGMMRKDEKAVQQWSPGLVESCARLQQEIATDVIPALCGGGYLVYSTCTFSRRENEEMVEWLMDEYGMESVDLGLGDLGVPDGWTTRAVTHRFMPHLTEGEGLFVAVLRMPDTAAGTIKKGKKKEKRGAKALSIKRVPTWVASQDEYTPVAVGEAVHLIPTRHFDLFEALRSRSVRMLGAGICLGDVKRDDIIPSHALAMSTALLPNAFPDVELTLPDALDYLRREAIVLPEGTPRGFVTVSHGGRKLGFVKNIGNRANNLYPAQWRIRTK